MGSACVIFTMQFSWFWFNGNHFSSQVTSNSYFTSNADIKLFLPCQKDKKITDLIVKNFNTG